MILRSGSVVRLRSGLVVVLLNNKHEMWWNCKVISSDQSYQIGDILAHSDDLREGVGITRFWEMGNERNKSMGRSGLGARRHLRHQRVRHRGKLR